MNDLSDTLWTAFAAETGAHLAAIEPLLLELGSPQADVPALFRAFHSLKGLAAAMSFHGMEQVAHQAESVLGLVRDKGAPVTDAMVDTLLEASDGLRLLREAALARQPDAAPPPALMARLATAYAASGGGAAPGHAEVPGPAPAADAGLGQDAEMLGLYAEMLQTELPALAGLTELDETARGTLDDALESLAHGAGMLEMEPLAELLLAIRQELAARPMPLDTAGQAALGPMLHELADKAALLGELLVADTGAEALSSGLDRAAGGPDAAARATALATLAEAMAAPAPNPGLAPAARHVAELAQAWRPAGPAAGELAALLGDVAPRLASGALPPDAALADAIARAALALPDDEDAARAAAAALRLALAGPGAAPRGWGGALLAALDPGQRRALEASLAAGKRAYALTLFLEDAPLAAGALLAWLPGVAEMPSNRSVFAGSESWFEVLLVTGLEPEALRDGLRQHDPDRACLREIRPEGDVAVPLGEDAVRAPDRASMVPGAAASGEIRIQGAVIDRFMDGIAETRARLAVLENLVDGAAARDRVRRLHGEEAAEERARQSEVAEQLGLMQVQLRLLHGAALEGRVVPMELALSRLPRVVRTLAREQGKEVELVLEGRDVRVDKALVDRLVEPLLHMVRNAVDHGIEAPEARQAAGKPPRARLLVRAEQRAAEVVLTVADDGKGLDRDRILARAVERGLVGAAAAADMPTEAVHRLIFAAGFSTAATLTETSGRGVGMDVVLTEVHLLGGEVGIGSTQGAGTRFTLRLPLTAATQAAVLVRAGGQCLAVPERAVAHVAETRRDALAALDGRPAMAVAGQYVPVVALGPLLWPGEAAAPDGALARMVVVTRGGGTVAFEVDEILRRQELLLLRLHPALAHAPCVGGAAVLGDGEVVLLLDVDPLMAAATADAWQVLPA